MKPVHANWIFNGWKSSCIDDALRLGSKNLPFLVDPFQDIDPVMDLTGDEDNLATFFTLSENERGIPCSNQDDDDDDDAIDDEACIRDGGSNVDELADSGDVHFGFSPLYIT